MFQKVAAPMAGHIAIASKIAVFLILLAVTYFALSLLFYVMEEPVSKLLKRKSARIEIRKRNGEAYSGLGMRRSAGLVRYISHEIVIVEFLDRRFLKRRMMYMSNEGIKEGDRGIIEYQGRFVRKFTKESSWEDRERDIYYHFGFDKVKKEKSDKAKNKERKQRRYW